MIPRKPAFFSSEVSAGPNTFPEEIGGGKTISMR
jgi:hypothetical protein